MTRDRFRRVALGLPEATESAHLGTPDFRVGGKIFATLSRGEDVCCVVKFTREQLEMYQRIAPSAVNAVSGGWGRKGWTRIDLGEASDALVRDALTAAWHNVASKKIAALFAAKKRAASNGNAHVR